MTENGARHLSEDRLSSYLDGERSVSARSRAPEATGPEETEREIHLDSCEACRARLEGLRAARLLVATPVNPPPAEVRARAIASALAVFEETDEDADETTSQVVSSSRGPWYRRPRVFLGATAAAMLALAVALPLTLTGKGASTTSAAKSTHSSASRASAGEAGQAAAGATGSAGASSSAASGGATGSLALADLGTVSSKKELVSRVRALAISYPATPSPANNSGQPSPSSGGVAQPFSVYSASVTNCVTTTQEHLGAHYGPGVVATVTYDGQRSIVMELWRSTSPPPTGEDHVAVATEEGCKLLLTATF